MAEQAFDDYLDLVQASREIGIHPQSLRRLIKKNRIPATIFKSNYDPRPGRKHLGTLL